MLASVYRQSRRPNTLILTCQLSTPKYNTRLSMHRSVRSTKYCGVGKVCLVVYDSVWGEDASSCAEYIYYWPSLLLLLLAIIIIIIICCSHYNIKDTLSFLCIILLLLVLRTQHTPRPILFQAARLSRAFRSNRDKTCACTAIAFGVCVHARGERQSVDNIMFAQLQVYVCLSKDYSLGIWPIQSNNVLRTGRRLRLHTGCRYQ